ncbi:MAG: type II toxin-antitoxin system RelE/ParE family toxin [Candidatus Brocadiaceae bacterium]|nr:type II toxin-antitoxin system RelE/ParE family toxin [Candidatus Brocadiaceae bacterium]
MGRYKIEFSKTAAKVYKKLPEDYKGLIDLVLLKISKGLPADIKSISGEKNLYRIRVGKYRILFTITKDIVVVIKIGPRGDIYK